LLLLQYGAQRLSFLYLNTSFSSWHGSLSVHSERRASAVACYVADYLKAQGVKDFTLRVGFFGDART